jgi:hypothetical protein
LIPTPIAIKPMIVSRFRPWKTSRVSASIRTVAD